MELKLTTNTSEEIKTSTNKEIRLSPQFYNFTSYCKILDTVDMRTLSWKIEIDEAIRSLKQQGILEFILEEHKAQDLINFWFYLGRVSSIRQYKLLEVERVRGNSHKIRIEITRRILNGNSWSICYITNGNNLEQIRATENLVKNMKNIQLLVCGPKKLLLRILDSSQIIDDSEFKKTNLIAAKKNLLISNAKNENLLLLHDRYEIAPDFFESFKNFGYDFGIAVPNQIIKETNINYPGLLNSQEGNFGYIDSHIFEDSYFVNGGCIALKREIALNVKLNPFLSWGEQEDVEWSKRLRDSGEVFRITEAKIFTVNTPFSKISSIKMSKSIIPRKDLFSELRCLEVNEFSVFFSEFTNLLNNYRKVVKNKDFAELPVLLKRVNFSKRLSIGITPERFLFGFYFVNSFKPRKGRLKVGRLNLIFYALKYLGRIAKKSKFKAVLVLPASILDYIRFDRN